MNNAASIINEVGSTPTPPVKTNKLNNMMTYGNHNKLAAQPYGLFFSRIIYNILHASVTCMPIL